MAVKIWATADAACPAGAAVFRRIGTPAVPHHEVLAEVREAPDSNIETSAWYVPPGHAANVDLLSCLRNSGLPVYIAVNGLGSKSIEGLRQQMQGANWLLSYQDVGADDVAYFQQLNWLRAQPEPVAVVSADAHRLMVASFIGPAALVYAGDSTRLVDLLRVLGAFSRRPLSPQEVDTLEEGEASLTVGRPCAAGTVLRQEDLAVAVSHPKGLSPMLRETVAGCTLRYAVAPGEALTFGHLFSGTKA